MAEDKKSFLLYSDSDELFQELSDVDAGQLIKHIFSYVNDRNPVSENPMVKVSFIPIKQQLKRDLKKWEGQIEKKSEGGIIGNLKRWHLDLYNKFKENKITLDEALKIASDRIPITTDRIPSDSIASIAVTDTVNETVNDNVSVTDTVNEKEKKKPLLFTSILDATSLTENENIAFSFWTLFKENLIATGISKTTTLDNANMTKWTNDIRLMIENDKRTVQEIRTVWHFLKSNEFWKKNIQSTSKLREQFERLFQEAKTIKPKDQKEQARKDWGEDLARRLKAMYNN